MNPTNSNHSNSQTNANKTKWVYLSIIALLITSNIVLYLRTKEMGNTTTKQALLIISTDSTKQQVENEYNAALSRLDNLISDNKQLDSVVNNKNSELEHLKKEIKKIVGNKNATKEQLAKAIDLIKNFNSEIRVYEDQIASLKKENLDLNLDKKDLTEKVKKSDEENQNLKEAIRIAQQLQISNIRLIPLSSINILNKSIETKKANKVDKIRMYFDIDKNKITNAGNKQLFIQIKDPNGEILTNAQDGSGVTTNEKGETIAYTLIKNISLKSNEAINDVMIDWKQAAAFKKGTYQIFIIYEGDVIGYNAISLK
jgi:hypothetical protein